MVKTKRKGILRSLLFAVFALCFAVGLSSLFASGTTAYAAAVTTPKYAIPISYSTWYSSNGGKSITGGGTALSFSARIGQYNSSTYSVSLYGSGASGTETWDGYIRSSTVTIVLSSSSGTPTVSVVNSAGHKDNHVDGTCRWNIYGKFWCEWRLACKCKAIRFSGF